MATPPTNRTTSRTQRRRQERRRRRRRLIVAAIVVAVLVLGGVGAAVVLSGGDDDQPAASSGTRESSTTGATTEPTTATEPGAAAEPGEVTPTTAKSGGPCEAGDVSGAVASSRPTQDYTLRVIVLTNTSKRSCTILGSTALQLKGASGEALPTQSVAGGGAVPNLPAETVTIEPGATGSFVVGTDNRTDPCLDVRTIDLTLPGDKKTVPVEASINVCANGVVNVSPVQPGTVGA